MRILHTSDWHLGHTLHDLPREHEHRSFLAWLLGTIEARQVDALLVAGDVFDTANPSAAAQAIWYRFVAEARRRFPALDIVVIGGNHDSADRLDAPAPLFVGFDVRVVGGLPRGASRALEVERLLVPLRDGRGEVAAWVAAVPFLRPADLLPREGADDPLIEGVRAVYAEVLEAARARREPEQAIVAMGHCYMVKGEISELSERRILGGNQHALPLDIFPEDVAYAALGHLHRPQRVGRENVRYSGSPLPLSMAEIDYRHQVCLVELEGEKLGSIEEIPVPRAVELLRVPKTGTLPPEELLAALKKLPKRGEEADHELPFLEVRTRLEAPEPGLRARVEAALAGRAARLVRLGVELSGDGRSLAEQVVDRMLDELKPGEVFANCYRKRYEGAPPPDLLVAFDELLDAVHQEKSR